MLRLADHDRSGVDVGAAVAGALAVAVLVLVADHRVGPHFGTSPAVVAAMLVGVAAMVRARRRLSPGWREWRTALTVVTATSIAYPGLWAVFTSSADVSTTSVLTRVTGALAAVGHVPELAALSVLPILVCRYLGAGSSRRMTAAICLLALADAVGLFLFGEPTSPARPVPLVSWSAGATLSDVANDLFLVSTLAGPVVSIAAVRRACGPARGRLVLVSVAALTGPLLVLSCSVLGVLAADVLGENVAYAILFIGMYGAVAAVATATSRALRTPFALSETWLSRACTGLLAGLAALTALCTVLSLPLPGPSTALAAATIAIAVTLASRPCERWLAAVLLGMASGEDAPSGAVASPRGDRALPGLTPRESEVLALMSQGLSNEGIAARLVLSPRTVESHVRSVFIKLGMEESPLENRRVRAVVAWHHAQGRPGEAG